ncbi:MAG: hypothetical protein RLP02_09675, partial [Coleofasciculus sp. C2-GNP5-27]
SKNRECINEIIRFWSIRRGAPTCAQTPAPKPLRPNPVRPENKHRQQETGRVWSNLGATEEIVVKPAPTNSLSTLLCHDYSSPTLSY